MPSSSSFPHQRLECLSYDFYFDLAFSPSREKEAAVMRALILLELMDLADAVIGSPELPMFEFR